MDGITPTYNVGGNDGFGGGMGIWAFLIFALLLGGNGGFFGGNQGNTNAIQADVNRGFDNQNLQAQTRDILSAVTNGTAQSVAATNQTFHDTLNAFNDKYSELARDVAGLAVGQANLLAKQNECCCASLRAIDGVNYNNAMNTAAIKEAILLDGQKTRDLITENKIEAMQARINQLELNQAVAGVVRYPNQTTYCSGANPFGCGCNGNI